MSDELPAEPRKPRTTLEPISLGGTMRRGMVFVYAALAVGLAGLAVYMGLVAGRPLVSGYVAAPAIGAMWFGLRLFMMLGARR
ncbi:MAG: hypothetical protein ABL864_00330 [Terricaulis sp.]